MLLGTENLLSINTEWLRSEMAISYSELHEEGLRWMSTCPTTPKTLTLLTHSYDIFFISYSISLDPSMVIDFLLCMWGHWRPDAKRSECKPRMCILDCSNVFNCSLNMLCFGSNKRSLHVDIHLEPSLYNSE